MIKVLQILATIPNKSVGVLKHHSWSPSELTHPVATQERMSKEKLFSYSTSLIYFFPVPHEPEIHWVKEHFPK